MVVSLPQQLLSLLIMMVSTNILCLCMIVHIRWCGSEKLELYLMPSYKHSFEMTTLVLLESRLSLSIISHNCNNLLWGLLYCSIAVE